MLYSRKTALFTQKANKTSHSNAGRRRHTVSSLEREGENLTLVHSQIFSELQALQSLYRLPLNTEQRHYNLVKCPCGQCHTRIVGTKILLNLWGKKDFFPCSLSFIKLYWLCKCDIQLCQLILFEEGRRGAGNVIHQKIHQNMPKHFPSQH